MMMIIKLRFKIQPLSPYDVDICTSKASYNLEVI